MRAWWFVIEQAIIVICTIFVQELFDDWYFWAIGGCSGEIEEAKVGGVAVYDRRLMRHDHFEGYRDVWVVRVRYLKSQSFWKSGVESYFTLFNQLHKGHTDKALGNGGDSDYCIIVNRLIPFILLSQIGMIDNFSLLRDFKLYSSYLFSFSKLNKFLIKIYLVGWKTN